MTTSSSLVGNWSPISQVIPNDGDGCSLVCSRTQNPATHPTPSAIILASCCSVSFLAHFLHFAYNIMSFIYDIHIHWDKWMLYNAAQYIWITSLICTCVIICHNCVVLCPVIGPVDGHCQNSALNSLQLWRSFWRFVFLRGHIKLYHQIYLIAVMPIYFRKNE